MLGRIDAVQHRFLRNAGVDEIDALVHFNLVPLAVRCDVANLGVIHRAALGWGPVYFQEYFKIAPQPSGHQREMLDPWRTLKPACQEVCIRTGYGVGNSWGEHRAGLSDSKFSPRQPFDKSPIALKEVGVNRSVAYNIEFSPRTPACAEPPGGK